MNPATGPEFIILRSPGTALLLNPVIGYEKTAEIVKEAKDLNSSPKVTAEASCMCVLPVAGFNEIVLPAVQPGSSIMPGKVNPSILEAVPPRFNLFSLVRM